MNKQGGAHRVSRPKGTAAIVAGCLIAAGGVGAAAWSLRPDSSPDSAATASSTPGATTGSMTGSVPGVAPGAGSSSGSGSGAASAGSANGSSASAGASGSGSGKGSSKGGSSGSSGSSTKKSGASVGASSVPPNNTVLPNPTGQSKRESVANPAGATCVPSSLTVSSVGIAGEGVVPMGTNSQGQIYPPPRTTMWYNRSAQPGQDGIAVIAGHVTYDGPDNFYNLRTVGVGAPVTVRCSNGKVVSLRVTGKQSVPKTSLTTDQRVWGGSDTPVVTLVTCDNTSRMVNGHYLNNYVVWTRPA